MRAFSCFARTALFCNAPCGSQVPLLLQSIRYETSTFRHLSGRPFASALLSERRRGATAPFTLHSVRWSSSDAIREVESILERYEKAFPRRKALDQIESLRTKQQVRMVTDDPFFPGRSFQMILSTILLRLFL